MGFRIRLGEGCFFIFLEQCIKNIVYFFIVVDLGVVGLLDAASFSAVSEISCSCAL